MIAEGHPGDAGAPTRLKILHLAFEDHRRPGSGGGSVRNREINRRLARHHDITVVTAAYAGAVARTEDGVRYEHRGLPAGYFVSLMTYFAALPFLVWRRSRDYDLVIEEFGAPLSSMSVARWSRRPTLASVQWLNSREKSRQYKVPFFLFERWGVRSHRHFVTVSQAIRDELVERNPRARVTVLPNGVPPEAFAVQRTAPGGIVYLGRLEVAQKGLDVLLEAYAIAAKTTTEPLILVGDGPDRPWLEQRVAQLGLTERVVMAGRLEGEAKWAVLAAGRVLAMPSRYETFGMVAAEALAVGTPVVASDLPCLREIVKDGLGRLVPTGDVAGFAQALTDVCDGATEVATAATDGRASMRRFDWDLIASGQEKVYGEVVRS